MIPPLFHISFSKALPVYLYPRQPAGLPNPDDIKKTTKQSIYAENLPPRISFSPSVGYCFRAVWPNIHHHFTKYKYPYMDWYVYTLIKGNEHEMLTPEKMTDDGKLWDAFFTKEHCFLTKVKIKKIAKVRIFNPEMDKIPTPKIHPYNNDQYKLTNGSPDPRIEVLRIYDKSLPLIIGV